ncbi:MAG: hypothetical protein E6I30_06930 [Chloroflexi bacterium]|nr:MAG: hypothetical protein E6I30_06930 [Chloroflexota bacterium]
MAGRGGDRGAHRVPGRRAGGRRADRVHQAARCDVPPLPAGRGVGRWPGPGREDLWRRLDGSAWIRDRRGGHPRGRTRSSGRLCRGRYDTICVHGDTPGAGQIASAVRGALREAGIETAPLAG